MSSLIYMDYNATTPVDERVLSVMLPYFTEKFGNANSSTHAAGWIAQQAVDTAREQVAALIHCIPAELIFTSGSTEAINMALLGVWENYRAKGNHIVTVATEHKAVLDTVDYLEKKGASVTLLPVNEHGQIDLQKLASVITDKTILVAAMLANNETGVIHPVKEIAQLVHSKGSLFFCDATQAIGKIPVDVQDMHIDLMCISAHKFYGPKGVGALYLRRKDPRVNIPAFIHGGGHERGIRSGTLNVTGIVGLGKAASIASVEMEADKIRIAELREYLETHLKMNFGAVVHGEHAERLYTTCNCSFPGTSAAKMIKAMPTVALSMGSACTSATMEPSHVLTAMGVSKELILSSVRFSLGRNSSKEQVDALLVMLKSAIENLN